MSCVSWFVCCWKKDVRSVEVDHATTPRGIGGTNGGSADFTGIGGTNGGTNALGNGGTNGGTTTLGIGETNALGNGGTNGGTTALGIGGINGGTNALGNGGTNGGTTALEGKGKNVTSGQSNTAATSFSFQELSMVTGGFKELIGEGGFGRVYKGCLPTGQLVAVKQLDPDGLQGCQEFVTEVLMLCMLSHSNLVNLIGYCTNIDQKLLVYEYMPKGCLEDHLFDLTQDKEPLSWSSRMKIAVGVARGLEYLHCTADPSIIYRDMKSANILLDNDFNAKLSDFGLAKLGPIGDNTHISTRVMGTQGYCAPEYAMTGKLTQQSDIYSFGVVLLELVTGRRALDDSRKRGERDLISWSRPFFNDERKYKHMVDPLLQGNFPNRGLYQIIYMIAMCLLEKPKSRPLIGEIVETLEYLASQSTLNP